MLFFQVSNSYKQGQCLNLEDTLSTFLWTEMSGKLIAIVYYNKVFNDSVDFEKYIIREFFIYCNGNESYEKGLNYRIL